MRFVIFPLLTLAALAGCSHFQRSAGSGYGSTAYNDSSRRNPHNQSTQQTAYELGKDPDSLSATDLKEVRNRQQVKELERSLRSGKEKEQYSKVLPWFRDDEEKIEFLTIPSLEGRQQWVNRKGIWDRAKAPHAEMKRLIESQDIAVGMPQEYVKKSWGEPMTVEISGNPLYKNERWKYQRMVASPEGYRKETRFVYFEGGRVVGWETQ